MNTRVIVLSFLLSATFAGVVWYRMKNSTLKRLLLRIFSETATLFFILYLIALLLFSFLTVKGQNLVPNGDFEQYSSCPTSLNQLSKAVGWINPATNATPDYFHQCGSAQAGVPANYFGNQQAHSGAGYCGLMQYFSWYPDYREYAEVQLTSPLQANQCYHLEMYVSKGDNAEFSTDDLAVYFSDTLIAGLPFWTNLSYTPQIINTSGIIANNINWVLISGSFQAAGGENYLLIGNFQNDSNITLLNTSGSQPQVYYYFDDVSLTTCTGTGEIPNSNNQFSIYPNPVKDELFIKSKSLTGKGEIVITDILGKQIYRGNVTSNFKLQTSNYKSGIYFIEINNDKEVYRKKFLKE